tara:strand:+ start:2386 stop:3135 length:750 start_codon:yes stop_codon:yes gene_type:complete
MALVLENGIWLLQSGGSNVTAVAQTKVPAAGTPSSIADGATLDAGMLSGWTVKDPNGVFNAMVDDGTTFNVKFDQGDGGTSTPSNGNGILTNGRIIYPNLLMGDFDLSIYVDQGASAENVNTEIALMAGGGNATGEAHWLGHRYGRWNAANAKYYGIGAWASGGLTHNGTQNVSRTTARWVGLKRVSQTVSFREGGTAATPSWSDTDKQWDAGGGAVSIGISFFAGSASEETYRLYKVILNGSEYTATP